MKLVDPLPRTVGQGGAGGGGEDRSDLSMLGVRIPLAHERFPHTTRGEGGRVRVTIPVEPCNNCRIEVPVAHRRERGARGGSAVRGGHSA